MSGEGESGDLKSNRVRGDSGSVAGRSWWRKHPKKRQADEKSLDDSLGDFDKTLKKEQERVAKERDAKGTGETQGEGADSGAGSGEGAGEGSGSGQPRSGDLQSSTGNQSKGGNNEGDPNGAEGDGKKSSGGGGAGSQKVRTGSDDDIVAKRLRKALKRNRSELKERLEGIQRPQEGDG